ncbi:MAG: SDR family oxidoreductase [Candidatus Devosia phytovorans]|uniref:Phenolphthiocerol/phthiocerol polyketide synthase subunit E n=1 Tax=Candidatus Devosia phytovorans TaxID=3121372 RepID=A0AAJ6B0P6_9HYPH|nr:type I polyketide synthase [Devosia sp.]WEK03713.1 MAG: SDR family oxidoreductase [Devosia sp.]
MLDASEISASDIAIVGMALRVPGANTVSDFWANLLGGVESIRQLTPEELAEAERAGDPIHEANYVPRTSDLQEMEFFDADFFGLSPKEAAVMDPQHRHFLECAWEALEDAARMPSRQQGPVGVFAASGMGSYFYFNVCSDRELVDQTGMFLLRHTGNDKDFLSTRVSFSLDLRGPSVNVQTACSSSLVAVHYAAQSLMNGECDMALAGGVTIEQPHRRGYSFQEGEILSPDGHCRAFDHRAAGTVFGSGVGVVALRRLSDAIADGDTIHAVIKASAINNDGASKAGYLAPSVTGQAEAIIEAQGLGGIEPDSIGYVECHGTGTYLGDPIEIQALTEAFRLGTQRRNFCRVGSVKSNIGHLDTAAGVVSLIKAALTVKHGKIPPTLGFEKPNPAIDFTNSPFVVNDKLTDWAATAAPRRAGINSLGVGGTNAHVVIEQPPKVASATAGGDSEPTLLLLSAKSRKALDAAQVRLGEFIRDNADTPLADIAHTLLHGREAFEHRAALAVRDHADASNALLTPELKRVSAHTALDNASGAVFLFPGGGAQHHGMARNLYRNDKAFQRLVDEGIAYLPVPAAAELRTAWLEADEPAARLLRPSIQLPAILIIEVALGRLFMARGITPKALVGHSMGENSAACLAGVFTFKDAVNLVRLRGELFESLPKGGMLSVPVGEAQLRDLLPAELDMASVNAPGLCVVSGPDEALDGFTERLKAQGIDASRITIDVAAHSQMLEPILAPFRAFLASIRLSPPNIRIISNVTGQTLSAADATSPDYWTRHLRSTVRFEQCLAELSGDASLIYIETGPSRALSSLAKAQGNIDANRVINALPHPDEKVDDQIYCLTAIGRVWATGLSVPAEKLVSAGRRIHLPSYPFQHRKFFIERQQPSAEGEAPLLRLDDMAAWGYRPAWRRSVPDIVAGGTAEKHTFLVFLNDADTGQRLAQRLRDQGHRVVTIAAGDGFARRDADTYVVCPEHGRAGYDALAAGLAADQVNPDRVAYLPLLTHTASFRPGSSFFNRIQENGFQGLMHLMQALSEANIAPKLHITAITNGAQQVDGEGLAHPEKATLEGPALVIPREFEGTTLRLIDVELETRAAANRGSKSKASTVTADDLLETLVDELSADAGSEVVAWRKARRWSRTHVALPLTEPQDRTALFRDNGTYLLTGGLGDLALTFASQLVTTKKARIALLARTALPTREQWPVLTRVLPITDRRRTAISAIEAMEQAGGEVLALQGDVTNPLDVKNALDQITAKWGSLTGVLHTAGMVDDAPLLAKTVESAELVLAPKVVGTMVLAEALADQPIETLVLFSSTSSDSAPAGQVDYVAANAFLNAFAESQASRTDRKTVAVHWGIWTQVGMAARSIVESDEATRTLQPAKGPFFQRWIEDGDGTVWLEADIAARTNWLFNEHRLASGEALMPGTGYVELISQAMREADLPAMAITDLEFRSPMFAPEGQLLSVRLGFGYAHGAYSVTVASSTGDGVIVNALAHLTPAQPVLATLDVATIQARTTLRTAAAQPGEALKSAQEDHLRFGPRWKVLRTQQSGANEAFARLALADSFKPDLAAGYQTHPGLLDIATGFAMDIVPGYTGSNTLWAPASYGRITQLQPLPAEIVSWVRLADSTAYGEGFAGFDIVLATPEGAVLLVVEKLLLRRIEASQGLVRMPAPKRHQTVSGNAQRQLAKQVRQGILPHEALDVLERALATGATQPVVSSMDLPGLIRRADLMASGPRKSGLDFGRSTDLDSSFVAPSTTTELRLASFWRELLGIEQIGIDDNFFDIGGHSLVAVRLFRSIRKEFGVDLPISTLFEAPTIALLCKLLPVAANDELDVKPAADAQLAVALTHRVAMHIPADASATPLFICAGMFGNVLNLRQLARQVGTQRPVYGLQARGIYGDTPPHETFEEAAASCIVEMRAIHPEGPYLLAGFSGGGLVAYEMAQQLKAAGEEVSQLIMLDTPLPTQPDLSKFDRVTMKLQDLRRDGTGFFTRWIADRIAWQQEKLQKQEGLAVAGGTDRLNNEAVEAAFRRALIRYQVRPYAGSVALFRPQPEIEYHLSNGRKLMAGRNFFFEDNGWTPLVDTLSVVVVPGDHDSMVLDPSVRVLSNHIRRLLAAADTGVDKRKAAE